MDKIQANMVIEILGKPKDNVTFAINDLVKKLAVEKGVKIIEQTIHEPVKVKDSKDLFTTFAEIVAEFDSVSTYLLISFAYLPSNVDLISPEKITMTNQDLTFLGNKIIQRVHEYDAIVKNTLMERDIILKKLQEVAPHLFIRQPQPVQSQNVPQAKQTDEMLKPKSKKAKKK